MLTGSQSSKITISIPTYLLETLDMLVNKASSNRSAVIASLIKKFAQEKLEAELREGYLAMAEISKQIADEWASIGDEVWVMNVDEEW